MEKPVIEARDSAYAVLAAAMSSQGQPGFPAALAQWLRVHAPYCFTVVFGYRGKARPLNLHDDFPPDRRDIYVRDYQEGPYLLDPFYHGALRPVQDGLYRLRDLAPDRFYQGEYFRSYYGRTALAEEIGFFTRINSETVVVMSLMRSIRSFTAREFRLLGDLAPVVHALQKRHWALALESREDSVEQPARARRSDPTMGDALSQIAAGTLTTREREVVEFVLKGYSAEATGNTLGISLGTVRAHRRNIYRKMAISSQGELFSRFLAIVQTQ